MANVNIAIDGTTYSVVAQLYTVKSLINTCITPGASIGNNLHALTVLNDTGGTPPAYQDLKNCTVQGRTQLQIRGGEQYASGSGTFAAGDSQGSVT